MGKKNISQIENRNSIFGWLLAPDVDPVVLLLQSWRLWLAGALLGGILGLAAYYLFPPPYRAQATVVVSHNLEQVMPTGSDREIFYYLSRETNKLVELAWADVTLQKVHEAFPGFSVSDLRDKKLILSQPGDGPWHFWAEDDDLQVAERLASTWAGAFTDHVREGIIIANAILKTQQVSSEEILDSGDLEKWQALIAELEQRSLGISPFVQISFTQAENLPVARSTDLGTFIFLGAGLGTILVIIAVYFFLGYEKQP